MKHIFIRADGSKDIGMGHINRALIISEYLFEEFNLNCTLITKSDSSVNSFINSKKQSVKTNIEWLPIGLTKDEEAKSLSNFSSGGSSTLYILDLLEKFRPVSYIRLLENVNSKIMLISDSSKPDNTPCDYFVNGNPCLDQDSFDNSHPSKVQRFCGVSNFIMSPAHYCHEPKYPVCEKQYRLMVTIGGTDHNNILFKILESLNEVSIHHNIIVLIVYSAAAGYSSSLKKFTKALQYSCVLREDIRCLSHVWGDTDIAITAGGNTLFERVAAGIPGMTITQLERQTKIAKKFQQLGVNFHIGYGPEVSASSISSSINTFLSNNEMQVKQFLKCKSLFKKNPLDNIFKHFLNI